MRPPGTRRRAAGWRCATAAPAPATTTSTSSWTWCARTGKWPRTGNDFSRFPALCADMERRYGLSAVEGRANKDGDARAHPGRGGEGAPHRTGRNGTGRARPGGAGCGYRRRQRSRVRAVAPGRRAGGQAPLRPRRRASRGRLRGGRGALRRRGGGLLRWGEAGQGPLAPGPTGPLARRRGREPGGRRRVGRRSPGDQACTRPLGPAGTSPTAGPRRQSVGASRRSGKSTGCQPSGRPAGWREATEGLGEVVRELGAVPAEDVTTWRAVASDAAGVLAVLSGRLERVPGPLAHASGLLARSAQGPRQRPAKVRCVPRGTIKSVAALMAQADLDEDTPAAWRLFFAEMLRVAQAVHDAHLARSESQQAGRLADEARKALDNVRARLGSLEALRAELLAVVEPAQEEVGRGQEQAARRQRRRAGQRCAAARAVRRDDNRAGTAETVLGSGEVSVAEGCWDERSALRAGLLVDAAPQIEQRHMHDAMERSCPGGCRALRHRPSVERSRPPRFVAPSLYGASRPIPGQFIGARSGQAGTAAVGWNKSMDIPRIHSASGPHQKRATPLRHRTTAGDSQLHWRAIGDRATPPGTDAVSVPGAERYTLWTVMSAPATLATLRMWPAFEVTTAWFRRTAPSTTETSTMSS